MGKQCRRNRDAEAKLMANEEGWEVGTWYGHPIYKTTGDKWIDVTFDEFYSHCDKEQKGKAANLINWLKWDISFPHSRIRHFIRISSFKGSFGLSNISRMLSGLAQISSLIETSIASFPDQVLPDNASTS